MPGSSVLLPLQPLYVPSCGTPNITLPMTDCIARPSGASCVLLLITATPLHPSAPPPPPTHTPPHADATGAGAGAASLHTDDHGAAAIMEDAADAMYLSMGMDTNDSADQAAEGQADVLAMEAVHEMADAGAAHNAEFAGTGTAQGASGGGTVLQPMQDDTDAASMQVPGDVGQHSAPAPASVQHHAAAGPVPADAAMETAADTAAGAAIDEAATGMEAAPSSGDATGGASMAGISDAAGRESGAVVPSLR